MEKTYLDFLLTSIFKKTLLWVCGIVVWFLILLFIIIIPLIFNKNPLFLWTGAETTQVSLCIVIAAMVSAEAVIIFRDGKEDGTDLLVLSKPIARWKVIFVKFIVFLIFNIIVTIVCALTALFSLCFPTMDPKLVGPLIASIIVGNAINILVFGSIAILFSMIFGKVATIATTIGISLLVTASSMIITLIAPSPEKILQVQYDTKVDSAYYVGTDGLSYPICWLSKPDEYREINSNDLWEEASAKSGIGIAQYFDIGKQLIIPYKSFGLQEYSLDDANIGSFAAYSNYCYYMTQPAYSDLSRTPYFAFSFANNSEIIDLSMITIFHEPYSISPVDAVADISQSKNRTKYFNQTSLLLTSQQESAIKNFYQDVYNQIEANNMPLRAKLVPFKIVGIDNFHDLIATFINSNKEIFDYPTNDVSSQIKADWYNLTALKILFEMFKIGGNNQKAVLTEQLSADQGQWTDQGILEIVNYVIKADGSDEEPMIKACNMLRITNYMLNELSQCYGFNDDGTANTKISLSILLSVNEKTTWDEFKQFYGFKAYEYLPANAVIGTWVGISLLIYTLAICVYSKTDFK